ncbi:MAG: endonuclease VIII [Gammaproteobacteria bacterium]|nr:MAG: endonuclease VIII [Gammaproteobacteria bacterium]
MPEGPEIRRAADQVEQAIAGQPVVEVAFGLQRLQRWRGAFSGSRVQRVETRGKAMLTRFDNGLSIYSHNQLYGRWICHAADETPDTRRQLRLAIRTGERQASLYSASDIDVLTDAEIERHPFLRKLGPDVLSDDLSAGQLVARLLSARFRNRQLGSLLTDQSFVAGLGNYLRCEILFSCALLPAVRPVALDTAALRGLAAEILRLPRQSYASGGITNDLDFARRSMAQGASFEQARFQVFRREGLPCYRCGAIIQKQAAGGQACFFCPGCQFQAIVASAQ